MSKFMKMLNNISRSQAIYRRQFSVYPTEKMKAVLPELRQASLEWMNLLSEGIPQEELDVFDSVLNRMQSRAREIITKREESR